MSKITDDTLMPFGKKYKGTPMIEVPASYLLWFYENVEGWDNLKDYVTENMEVLRQEAMEEEEDGDALDW